MVMKVNPFEEIEYGMSATRLGEVFDLDPKSVKTLLKDVEPDGDRHGAPFWRIASAAPYLVTPEGDLESYLRRVKFSDLPAKFQKEHWAALNLRAKYYKDRGDLWSTDQVYTVLSEVMTIVRSTSRLFVDELESNTTLTYQHRKAIQIELDKMLALMREKVKDAFKNYEGINDHVESIEENNHVEHTADFAEDESSSETGGEEDDPHAWLDTL